MISPKIKGRILIAVAKERSKKNDVCAVSCCKDSIAEVFAKKGIALKVLPVKKNDFKDTGRLKEKILSINPFCVFNLFEGFSGNPQKEAVFAKILEQAKVPFTGNGSAALRVCLDKAETKNILKKNNLPVAGGVLVNSSKSAKLQGLKFPLFVKPRQADASIGIDKNSLAGDKKELLSAIKKRLNSFPGGLVIEEFLPGREYSAALLGNNSYEVLGVSEIDYSKYDGLLPFLTYDAKWESETRDYRIFPDYAPKISKTLKKEIIALSRLAAEALGCRSYFRVDLREMAGKLFIIDVNPNPDINVDSGYMRLAYSKGYSYKAIIERIAQLAIDKNSKIG